MTTLSTSQIGSRRSLLPAAVAAGAAALLLTSIGTFVDTPYRKTGAQQWGWGDNHSLWELPLIALFAVLGTAVVFGVLVRGGLALAPERTARRSLVVAGVGILSIPVFWTGLPVILAAG